MSVFVIFLCCQAMLVELHRKIFLFLHKLWRSFSVRTKHSGPVCVWIYNLQCASNNVNLLERFISKEYIDIENVFHTHNSIHNYKKKYLQEKRGKRMRFLNHGLIAIYFDSSYRCKPGTWESCVSPSSMVRSH